MLLSFFFPSHSVVVSTPIPSSTWHFFLWWPRIQAVGLYLVRPMIKSAGLTSASDRPIHPTDTPPPPHTGRLNNLCTISNMKEDLLTLQSPPAPFSISLDCWDGYTASNRICLLGYVCVWVCACAGMNAKDSVQLYPAGVWQFWLLSNFMGRKWGGNSVIGSTGQKWSSSTQRSTLRISNLLTEFLFWGTCCLATHEPERAGARRLLLQPMRKHLMVNIQSFKHYGVAESWARATQF